MKMVMAVLPRQQSGAVLDALLEAGHTATLLESRGGMLRQSQHSLFIAAEAERLDRILAIIRDPSRVPAQAGPPEEPDATPAPLNGAVVFVWELEHMENF